ncbi:hypothetical protein MKW92_017956, partial [Papaver armeniacum]
DVLPIAKRLAEEVLEKCAAKVKPYMMQAVLSLSTSVHDYSKVVAAICQETCGNIKNDDVCAFEEHLVLLSINENENEISSFMEC